MIRSVAEIEPGDLYTTNGKDVWVVKGIFTMPSLAIESLTNPGEWRHLGLGGTMAEEFTRLVPEKP